MIAFVDILFAAQSYFSPYGVFDADQLAFRTQNTPTYQTNPWYENCSHFWDIFLISKNTFEPCSHIQSNTQNPNPIFKITIYCTK